MSNRTFRVCVDVPETSDVEGLFDAIARAAHDWEPEQRDGWDVDVHANVVTGDRRGRGMTSPLFATPDPRPPWERDRLRPWHYLVISRDYDLDDDWNEINVSHTVTGYHDDEATARSDLGSIDTTPLGLGDCDGLMDNWSGTWVVEPAWSDEIDICGEGFARYDLRHRGATDSPGSPDPEPNHDRYQPKEK